MENFNQQLLEAAGYSNVQQIDIDLSIAAGDKEYGLAGNYFYIYDSPDQTSYVQVKQNGTNQSAVSYLKQTGFMAPFRKLFITTPAGQTGTMKILIASKSPEFFQVIDNRSAISESMNDVLEELRGDVAHENWDTEKTVGVAAAAVLAANADRKACSLQAKSTNTGIIYVGFDDTVTSSKWVWELQPGQAATIDDYRGDLYAIATAAGQKLGWGEW
jgi:hypothetical protein